MAQGKRIVMKDVAARAGVHQTTVSMALRGHPGIPEPTRARIAAIAAEMGYRPDPALRTLSSYRRRVRGEPGGQTLAYVQNLSKEEEVVDNHVYREYQAGVRERAAELGYNVELFRLGPQNLNSAQLDRILNARGIQGLLLGAFTRHYLDLKLDWERYAVVKIELLPDELAADAVLSNQMYAVANAMQRLREELGPRRIGLAVAEHDELHNHNLFTAGYSIGQRLFPPAARVPACIFTGRGTREILPEIKHWAGANRIDVILSNWNNLDLAAAEVGLAEGRECRFVTLDANQRTRRYGGIDQNHVQVARWAVDLLDGKLTSFNKGLPVSHGMTLIEPRWIPLGEWDAAQVAKQAAVELRPHVPPAWLKKRAFPNSERLTAEKVSP